MGDSQRETTPAEIRLRYERGERDFRGLDIADSNNGIDRQSFREALLDGADFTDAFIVADFTRARLRGCRFVGANVKTCSFDEADLAGANFSDAAIDAATFRSARLDGADFSNASMYGYTLKPGEFPED